MILNFDHQYQVVLQDILNFGVRRENRTGVSTLALPSAMVRHDLAYGFPLLTLKKTSIHAIAVELEGFIQGHTTKGWYQERGCHIWDEWCNPEWVPYGTDAATKKKMAECQDLGPIYGFQWRAFGGDMDAGDQLRKVLSSLKNNPDDRRMVVSAWNPLALGRMALPPCHVLWHVVVIAGELHLNWYQRSADWFLGVPFNMASYALLASLLANQFGFKKGYVTGFFGDTHLYENQLIPAAELATRPCRRVPKLSLPPGAEVLTWTHKQLEIHDYDPHPAMRVEVVV